MLKEIKRVELTPAVVEQLNKLNLVIVGNGDIASALLGAVNEGVGGGYADNNQMPGLAGNRLYFASGVSNPNTTNEIEFQREKDLLTLQPKDRQIVYFSSLAVNHPEKPYHHHKLEMEELIRLNFPKYAIARLGIAAWGTHNPYTTINFLRGKVARNEPVKIRDTTRDVVEMFNFISQINELPRENAITEIHGKVMTEHDIFRTYVSANYPITT